MLRAPSGCAATSDSRPPSARSPRSSAYSSATQYTTIVPSAALYGGLAGLLATPAMGDLPAADEVSIAYALDSWHPTHGSVATGYVSDGRREGRRLVFSGGRLELRPGAAPTTRWTFPDPFGTQTVQADFTTADSVTVPHHLKVSEISSFVTLAPLKDLGGPRVTPPTGLR